MATDRGASSFPPLDISWEGRRRRERRPELVTEPGTPPGTSIRSEAEDGSSTGSSIDEADEIRQDRSSGDTSSPRPERASHGKRPVRPSVDHDASTSESTTETPPLVDSHDNRRRPVDSQTAQSSSRTGIPSGGSQSQPSSTSYSDRLPRASRGDPPIYSHHEVAGQSQGTTSLPRPPPTPYVGYGWLRRRSLQPSQGQPGTPSEHPDAHNHALSRRSDAAGPSELQSPRWQLDGEVTYCPICHSQFSIFVRKHHCRKCGRVVCSSCSPHRIMIPYQYIVRPPGSDVPLPQSPSIQEARTSYLNASGAAGGERVRLCNPCVPDPNTAPPHSPRPLSTMSSRNSHQRSRSSIGEAYGPPPQTNRHGELVEGSSSTDAYEYYFPRSRSITMGTRAAAGSATRQPTSYSYQSPFDRLLSEAVSSGSSAVPLRPQQNPTGGYASSSRQRPRRPVPQIAEEDECPICHRELPAQSLPNSGALRESHINSCIEAHSSYASPGRNISGTEHLAASRRTGMYTYPATEKDCIDDAECTICLEEFMVGVPMARLECLCRFHRSCISAWFVNHPGRCPVHQHDGFGY